MRCTRRQLLRGSAGLALGTTLVGTVRAGHPDEQPDHVTISFDRAELKTYRPLLDLRDADGTALQGLWAWIARSPEYDYDWYVYWARWTHQAGFTDYDSHDGDHEPIYVGVDPDTGRVQRLLYSAYHWLKASAGRGAIPFYEGTERPKLYVFSPWHHYRLTERAGVDVDLVDLQDDIDDWLANGMESELAVSQPYDPAAMQSRDHWWQRGTFGVSATALFYEAARMTGFHDGRQTDL